MKATPAQRSHRLAAKHARRRARLARAPHTSTRPGHEVHAHFQRQDAPPRGVIRHNLSIPTALRSALRRTTRIK